MTLRVFLSLFLYFSVSRRRQIPQTREILRLEAIPRKSRQESIEQFSSIIRDSRYIERRSFRVTTFRDPLPDLYSAILSSLSPPVEYNPRCTCGRAQGFKAPP